MTRANSKRAATALLSALLLGAAVIPAFARESPTQPSRGAVPTAAGADACARITEFETNLRTRVEQNSSEISKRRDERQTDLKAKRDEHQANVQERRNGWSQNWDKLIAKLLEKAQDDAQKAAVAAFKASMDEAFKTRQAAVDAASQAFRTALDKFVSDKKSTVDAAVSAYKTAVLAALDKAKADCASGVSADAVRTTLKASLDAARAKLQSDRKSIDAIGSQASELAKTRQAAIEQANASFKAAAEKARSAVKASWNLKENVK